MSGHTAPTVTVHHPDRPGSTMVVTLKAHQAVYAREGYVLEGADVAAGDVTTLQAQVAELQAQLAELRPADDLKPVERTATRLTETPRTRAPRKRAPRKAATAAPATLATGPADIGSTSLLDTDPALAGTPKETAP